MTDESRAPDDIDTEGRTLPPYEGRQKSGDIRPRASSEGDVEVGGATGPVEAAEPAGPGPSATPGGATGSPADEQPAAARPQPTGPADEGTGPAHRAGTPRAEDQS
jgi:hypothetical protein